jgi:hypothetical protein
VEVEGTTEAGPDNGGVDAGAHHGGGKLDAGHHDATTKLLDSTVAEETGSPTDETGPHDARPEDAAPPDAQRPDVAIPPTGDGCASNIEDCTNGIDDNCNGLVDCADPECTSDAGQFSCSTLPAVPGWTIVAYDSNGRPACPANFAIAPSNVIAGASGGADDCGCNCTNTTPASCTGAWAWTTKGATAACGTPPTSGINPIANGACVNTATDPLNPTYYFIGAANSVATTPGACTGTSAVTGTPAITESGMGETCALPKAGGGCGTGAVCAPRVPSGFQRCGVPSTGTSCPTGLLTLTVYTGRDDTRSCGGCACGTVDLACNVTGMQFWSNADCMGGVYDMSTSCQLVNGSSLGDTGGNSVSYRADLSTNNQQSTCAVTSASQPNGSVTPTGAITVCCEP